MRVVLDAEVQGGKAHATRHSLPRVIPPSSRPLRPNIVRGWYAATTPLANQQRREQGLIFANPLSAPQLTEPERWNALVRNIIGKIIAAQPKTRAPRALPPSNLSLMPSG